jgi:uncharacterized protein (DUF488 family)
MRHHAVMSYLVAASAAKPAVVQGATSRTSEAPQDEAGASIALSPIFTIGHSTRDYAEFEALLREHAVQCVVDVRKLAGSRRYPQYNADTLEQALAKVHIGYVHVAALGGRRGRSLAPAEVSANGFWTNESFRRYADYALSREFAEGLEELLALSVMQRCAVMCAEAVWWRCHRRIITDYLLLQGREVRHIMTAGRSEAAHCTPGAEEIGAADNVAPDVLRLIYPAPA